ncbi:MAG TPA: heavy metal translocating P-type ATPase [Rhodocyclaceae bacterium]|nr:heavy metal translocating P-type ATPase [Rhodocyclaceae bacterium]HNA02378.1 heavy metal translocating P-type ATPase [Rhodocyclaceae bacterium]HNB79257.1 heavy metal translocating P-type ATPase [Rhodocyclaceae bacterium]HNH13431.1 heavy metal translocating P-type ATPase [Rhodocyclaceae bacterium]HNH98315.1 heavy metal translocating P-type ATPase [Rhodocyclaceae bacterium]
MNAPAPEIPTVDNTIDANCYHCGLPVPGGTRYRVRIDGSDRRMCCAGCEAVAQAIVSSGLDEYYKHRDAMPESQREALPDSLKDLGLFDHPDFQKTFVRPTSEFEREAALILEGITCAACVWLNESHLARQPGVTGVEINYATHRARVRWDSRVTRLSSLLVAIAAIGYHAHPYDVTKSEELSQRERRQALWRVFVAGFGMMQVMMYAVPVYLADGDMTPDIEQLMRWASLILTLPVVVYSAAPFFIRAWRDIRLLRVGMDVPVALGVGSAFAASCWATLTGAGEVYFDSVTMFVFFLLGGRYLEMIARQKSVRGVEQLAKALPAFAWRLAAYPSLEAERVPVGDLCVGDVVLVKPGEAVPADAKVMQGTSELDESLLTGESRPVLKSAGDAVTGGTTNTASPLVLQVEHVGESTRLAAIQRLIERANAERPRVVETADRVATVFVAALLVLATATGLYWWHADPSRALWIFVAVLVVSCPCALSLATPAALTVATGAMSRHGLLITRGHAIETLARADHFVFDKTGTLTMGRLQLVQTTVLRDVDAQRALLIAAALEQGSEHAVAQGIRAALPADSVLEPVTDLMAVTGRGVEGRIAGKRMRLGRVEFAQELHGGPLPVAPESDTVATMVALADEGGWIAMFVLTDVLRPYAAELVRDLEAAGVHVSLVSGDEPATVASFAASLGIEDAHGGVSPQGKHAFIEALQRDGRIVAMVGDGVNDAPVLARAQVSIAMGGGTELARNQGDIVLLSERLDALMRGRLLARRAERIIRQNLWWSFGYNFVAIPMAMTGLITPWMAGIGMSSSSLLVVLNALRLQRRNGE